MYTLKLKFMQLANLIFDFGIQGSKYGLLKDKIFRIILKILSFNK